MFTYKGKTIRSVGFLGLGKSNLGVYEYLSKKFGNQRITLRTEKIADTSKIPADRLLFGENMLSGISEDILFLSPSARRDKPQLDEAAKRGVILSSDAEFFFSEAKTDIYAVTGSDGKSTTTYLTARLLSDSYSSATPCGNFGLALTPLLDGDDGRAHVTELSSFQLNYMKPRSERCVITNITENHLDWHLSFDEYINAKRNILDNSRGRILNLDSDISRDFLGEYELFAVFSRKLSEEEMKRIARASLYVSEENGTILASGEPILSTSKIRVGGEHNVLNFMAAIAMSYGRCKREKILALAEGFGGLPNRCELIGEFFGIKYYNSSIDTSPKRSAATLRSFGERVILILGGRSKGLDFAELVPTVLEKAKAIILTGECAEEIEEVLNQHPILSESGITHVIIKDFYEAVEHAVKTASRGDSVLFSPAATSYDSFKNFEERGMAFKKTVTDFYSERN